MESELTLINPFLIKEILNTYTDSSSFANYKSTSRDYHKLYHKIYKKFQNYSKEELKNKVSHWFFSQSLENRIKLCTVENEFLCQIIYIMHLYSEIDKNVTFSMKKELIDVYELNENNKDKKKDNNNLLEKYFKYNSDKISSLNVNNFNIFEGNIYFDEEENTFNANSDEFLYGIKFYSVHNNPFPDCFCLSQYLLLQEVKFDTTFSSYGNCDYFGSLIIPYYNNEKKMYSYYLPNWLTPSKDFTITQYIFAFIEQVIMIKFLLNNDLTNNNKKNIEKEATIFSLINDNHLNKIFIERKDIINYINNKYNDPELKKKIVDDAKIEKMLKDVLNDGKIRSKKEILKNSCSDKKNNGYGSSTFTKSHSGFKNNNLYAVCNKINNYLNKNTEEQNNYMIRKIKRNLNEIIERKDNIYNNILFIDYLWFQNFNSLWENEYFIYNKLIEYIINKFTEVNYNDLIKEETALKKKRRKKKKKNQNQISEKIENNTNNNDNNDNIDIIEKNENNDIKKNNAIDLNKIELDCYNELFKEKEKEKLLYIPYYFSVNSDLKDKYEKIKENKIKLIELNNKSLDTKEIYNYIKNEFLLKFIIDKVIHSLHEKYVTFSDSGNKEIVNENKKIYENLKENRINEEEIIIDKKKDELIEENINNNKEIKIRIKSTGKQDKNNILSRSEKKIPNNNESTENNIINSNININNIKDKIKSNSNNSNKNNKNTKKKREKSPNIFFLFDTMKNKNKRKPKSKSPNNIKTEKNNNLELSFIPSNNKSSIIYKDYHLYFLEKLHNNILNNDKKVDNILQPLIKIKNYCIEEIKKIIKSTYDSNIKDYTINLYGSFVTGLMIETSDIDIRIKINEYNSNDFNQYFISLSNKLKDVNKFENITPISTASVPVIKLLINIEKFIQGIKELEEDFINFKQLNIYKNYLFDKKELLQMKIDITFIINDYQKNNNELGINNKIDKLIINMNSNNELSSVLFIKKQLEEYPEIKPIIRLLKRYFYTKKMNSSFEGGLSSYNLFLLILSFAKYQKYFNINQNQLINLGAFLIQFLEFFGKNFDFKNYLININSPCIYESINSNIYQSGKSLIILDPLTGINASKSSYKINEIQKMFLNAFDYFEKESNIFENGFIKQPYAKHDNKNENILGLTKNSKKNKKDKICANIIDKFFSS